VNKWPKVYELIEAEEQSAPQQRQMLTVENARLRARVAGLVEALYEIAKTGPNCSSCITMSDIAYKAIEADPDLSAVLERERRRNAAIALVDQLLDAISAAGYGEIELPRPIWQMLQELCNAVDALNAGKEDRDG
jgi:hypothetical protein